SCTPRRTDGEPFVLVGSAGDQRGNPRRDGGPTEGDAVRGDFVARPSAPGRRIWGLAVTDVQRLSYRLRRETLPDRKEPRAWPVKATANPSSCSPRRARTYTGRSPASSASSWTSPGTPTGSRRPRTRSSPPFWRTTATRKKST